VISLQATVVVAIFPPPPFGDGLEAAGEIRVPLGGCAARWPTAA